jgi:hypothetical protein
MDVRGAEHLRRRIEQHQHWLQAQAVLDGLQPATDPDAEDLVELHDELRVYRDRHAKQLVNGWWHSSVEAREAS